MYRHIAKIVKNDQFGSNSDQCYIQNRVVTKRVIKRSRCTCIKSQEKIIKKPLHYITLGRWQV